MKHTSIVLVLVLTSFFAKGQAYSLTIDSLTTGYMKNLTKEQAVVFTRILTCKRLCIFRSAQILLTLIMLF